MDRTRSRVIGRRQSRVVGARSGVGRDGDRWHRLVLAAASKSQRTRRRETNRAAVVAAAVPLPRHAVRGNPAIFSADHSALAIAAAWSLAHPPAGRTRTWLLAAVLAADGPVVRRVQHDYRQPHTRVAASTWIYGNVAPGTTIAVEHWDDALPLNVHGRSSSDYTLKELKLYDEEGESKRQGLIAVLDAADLIAISSNRLYGSIPRTPWRYPVARRYYELLFSGELGFQLERVFTSYPRIGSSR